VLQHRAPSSLPSRHSSSVLCCSAAVVWEQVGLAAAALVCACARVAGFEWHPY
jgi:hypothetical protein